MIRLLYNVQIWSFRNLSKWSTYPLCVLKHCLHSSNLFSSTGIRVITSQLWRSLVIGMKPDNSRRHSRSRTLAPSPAPNVSLRLFSRYAFRHDRWDFSAFHRRRVEPRGTCQRFPARRWSAANNLGSRAIPVARFPRLLSAIIGMVADGISFFMEKTAPPNYLCKLVGYRVVFTYFALILNNVKN